MKRLGRFLHALEISNLKANVIEYKAPFFFSTYNSSNVYNSSSIPF